MKQNGSTGEEFEIDENATFRRVYDYLPYTHWRIKEILKVYFNAHLKCIRGYKEGRYPGYKQHYNIHDSSTGELIREHVYLDDLRHIFAGMDFPLHEPEKVRNPKAEEFLRAVQDTAADYGEKGVNSGE